MKTENRVMCFDHDLQIEASLFNGIMQKFPNHFHEYYVVGFVKSGCRNLICKNKAYTINAGDLVLFNPFENHTCEQIDDDALDWRCLHIKKDIMYQKAREITGQAYLPVFTTTVVCQSDAASTLSDLHNMIMNRSKDFNKEETFYFLLEQLISAYTNPCTETLVPTSKEIQDVCDYLENNYNQAITLDELSRISGFNKYTLLRNFTMQRGITPYQYLSTIRVNAAKDYLEAGATPLDAALQAGFTDQSHLTKFFKNFIGLTPKLYQDIFYAKKH